MSWFNRHKSSSSLSSSDDGSYPADKKGDMSHTGQHPVSFPQAYAPPQPPPYNPEPVSASGERLALGHSPQEPFPSVQFTGLPPFTDADRTSPVFIGNITQMHNNLSESLLSESGSAMIVTDVDGRPVESVHPCKIAPMLSPRCRVPYGGEREHHGRYDLLPFHPERMEWVPAVQRGDNQGGVPPGRRPVMGGYELWGDRPRDLYHARGVIQGVALPGKTGSHLVSYYSNIRVATDREP